MPVDESGFYLLPFVSTTWSPVGTRPILKETVSRDHLSLISAITPDGKLYVQIKETAIDGWAVVDFLCHLLRKIPGKLLIVWDRSRIHFCQSVRLFLETDKDRDILLVPFPSYSPELNPDEGVWRYLKNVELANVCCHDKTELKQEVRKAVKRLRHKPHVIKACFTQAGLNI